MKRLALVLLLAACSSEGKIAQYTLDTIPEASRISIPYATVEIRTISLPLYAESEEIAVLAEDGSIRTNSEQLWADMPERSMTEQLAGILTEVSGATVAAEPWPFESYPEARIDVRVRRLLADEDGPLEFAGTWYASADLRGRNRAESFSFTVPFAGEGLTARAEAHTAAARLLAEDIATKLR
ncbi:PqiC family protein [Algicella marina]|uniref:ABC-type transport auxiliary lipoprotein component domain-containing protein n=1 Tax=Algicella marina TaxID=2683284 RepID=A0A6P1T1X4_9RHOB|nr:ABC-type transport auxiliary lipoprotein family protein [Algicella marina]QHQ36738.1 hypothetical protein GO499_16925 [Algicella marina]